MQDGFGRLQRYLTAILTKGEVQAEVEPLPVILDHLEHVLPFSNRHAL